MTCYRESRLRVQRTLFTLRYNQLPGMNTTLEMGLLYTVGLNVDLDLFFELAELMLNP